VNLKNFYHGRTDVARGVSEDSVAFAHAMMRNAPLRERERLLRKCVEFHSQYVNNMRQGIGCERHLYGLYYLAKHRQQRLPGSRVPRLFSDPVYSRLKTDLMSTSNCGVAALNLFAFGPVCDDGFGLGYIVKDKSIHVNITSFLNQARKYGETLSESLNEIKQLLEQSSLQSSQPKL